MATQDHSDLRYALERSRIHAGFSLTYAMEAGAILTRFKKSVSEKEWEGVLRDYKISPERAEELTDLSHYHKQIIAQLGKADYTIEKALRLIEDFKNVLFQERMRDIVDTKDQKIGKGISPRDISLN